MVESARVTVAPVILLKVMTFTSSGANKVAGTTGSAAASAFAPKFTLLSNMTLSEGEALVYLPQTDYLQQSYHGLLEP